MTPRVGAMLALIPFAPRAITASQLARSLFDHGFLVTERTVQRDLVTLSRTLPIVVHRDAKPFMWSWSSCLCGRVRA